MTPAIDPCGWVDDAARSWPRRLFLKTPEGRRLSYAALEEHSGRMAAALAARGLRPGDRIAVQVEKSVEAVILYVACLRMGAVFVPINTANTATEVDYFWRDAQPRIAVVRPEDRALLEPLAQRAGVPHIETLGTEAQGSLAQLALDAVEQAHAPAPALDAARVHDAASEVPAAVHGVAGAQGASGANSLAAIVYTSGTTGRSKGAMLTRANLASNAWALAAAWEFTGADVLVHTLPLFHIHGLFVAINTVLASAASLLLVGRFDAESTLPLLADATVFMGVPTHYTRLLQQPGLNREVTASVRLFVSGSAPLLPETHRQFQERTGHVILERYGMTETLINTSNPYRGVRLPGSVGRPLPGVALRVANPRSGDAETEPGVGTLEVKGPNVFAGYWKDPEKTRAEFTADGWFKTGDVGRIDADGYVHIVGRAKDLVISGGYNVYPKEVEAELDALDGVLESAVFGVAHPDFGEGVTAAVVAKPGVTLSEAGIIDAVKARLARYKTPKRVLLLDELPRNAMGKVQKNVLRETFSAIYQRVGSG